MTRALRFRRGLLRRWSVVEPVVWHIGRDGSDNIIVIPAGTEFESSVPWWARWFIGQDDPRFLLAALVHDVMLERGIYGRAQAAAEWLDGALAGGAPPWKARVAYVGVAIWAVVRPDAPVSTEQVSAE